MQITESLKSKILKKEIGRGGVMTALGINESQARKLIERVRKNALVVAAPVATVQKADKKPTHETQVKTVSTAAKDRDAKIISLYTTGEYKTQEEVGKLVGCSKSTVGEVLKKAGIAPRVQTSQKIQPKVEAKKSDIKWMVGAGFLNIVADGKTYNATADQENFKKARDLCLADKPEEALALINVAQAVRKYTKGMIKVEGEIVSYKGLVVDCSITQRIVEAMNAGEGFDHLIKFFEKLMENPSFRAVKELYGFLQHNDLEIDKDGDVLAFKRVNDNYTDMYTGKMSNAPGKTVEMLRNQVNENSQQTCSAGLHVAAKSYIPHYGGGRGRIILCKISPADFVSIPVDYNNAKARVCRYIVVKDITEGFSHY